MEDEEKDLGDMRYNIINLVKAEHIVGWGRFLGIAPSYVNPNTGQIIGTTSNIILHGFLENSSFFIRKHIRHEIFQKDKNTKGGTGSYILSPYARKQIEEKCPEVPKFIKQKKAEKLKPGDELNDRDIILIPCSKKWSRDAILETLLHEMGHSFGLGHNFKASTDKDNYYKSAEEIKAYFPNWDPKKQIPESSSVMDYHPDLIVPAMTILGKYDLAALRYLYMDQLETKDGKTLTLDIPKDPDKQKSLTEQETILSQKKDYLYCPDEGVEDEDEDNYFCLTFDHGYSPKTIAEFYIQKSRYYFDSVRYRYDAISLSSASNAVWRITNQMEQLKTLFGHWLTLRNNYLISEQKKDLIYYKISEDTESLVENYNQAIQDNLESNKKYRDFYELREPIYNFFEEMIFKETMKCELTDDKGNKHSIDLELIKNRLLDKHGEKLYVEDCYSPMIQAFFTEQNLQLTGQKGIENFATQAYLSTANKNEFDIIPFGFLFFIESNLTEFLIILVLGEPNFLEKFRLKIKGYILDRDDLSQTDLERIGAFYTLTFVRLMIQVWAQVIDEDIVTNNRNHMASFVFKAFHSSVQAHLDRGTDISGLKIPFLTEEHSKWAVGNQQLEEEKQSLEIEKQSLEREIQNSLEPEKQSLETQLQSSSETEKQSLETQLQSVNARIQSLKTQIQDLEAQIQNKSESQIDFRSHLAALPTTIDKIEDNELIIPFQPGNFIEEVIIKYNENLDAISNLKKIKDPSFLEAAKRQQKEEHNEALLKIIKNVRLTDIR